MQRPAFFTVRITLAVASTLCEAKLYRTVVEKINERVGRYLFFMLLCSAGMWNASAGKFIYATGAIVGWPFALALAIPFVFEELFMLGADRVATSARGAWAFGRWTRLFGAGLAASLIFVSIHCVPSSFIEP
jgi:alpha-1,2-mannosyltransferase